MTTPQSRRTLSRVYRSIPDPGRALFSPLQAHKTNAHKAVDVLQVTGDVKQYISANTSAPFLIAAECFFSVEKSKLDVTNISHYVRRVTSVLSDRVSALWSIRESNSHTKMSILHAKYTAVGVLVGELKSVKDLFRRFLVFAASALQTTSASLNMDGDSSPSSSSSSSQHQLIALLHQLKHSTERVIPSLQVRLDNFVVQLVRDTTTENMRQYCRAHPRDFLVLQRTHSKVLHTLYNIIGVQSTHSTRKKQSEAVLFSLFRDHSIHPVYTSIALTCDAPVTQHFTALALNATVKYFLQYLVTHEERFDEPGVYQLFRTILKLQEYIGELKKELNMSGSQKLVQDSTTWRRAECILQVLNSEVFAVVSESAKNTTCRTRNANAVHLNNADAHPTTEPTIASSTLNSAVLTVAEVAAWKKLVGVQKRRHPLRRQRHKGTVFVTLEFDLNNL